MIKIEYDYVKSYNIKDALTGGEDPEKAITLDVHLNMDAVHWLKLEAQKEIKEAANGGDYESIIELANTLENIAYIEKRFTNTLESVKEELAKKAKEDEEEATEEGEADE